MKKFSMASHIKHRTLTLKDNYCHFEKIKLYSRKVRVNKKVKE